MARVLIADDSQANREVLKTIVTHMGHEVIEAKTGKEAIAQLENQLPDLILCDLEMPDGDGLDVVAWFSKQTPISKIPVLLITAIHDYASLRRRINNRGISVEKVAATFSKPIDLEVFASCVRSLLTVYSATRVA